ncbi:MAG: class I SAM-dependent methyltransferase [Bacteroidota bacterium]|nr:class I SAM-dependent methyltransferase [Bacteroidota bacterium]
MSNYIKFYNVVDRENKYSNTNKKENHPAYKDLEYCINKYNLRNHKTLEIGSGKGALQDITNDYHGIDIAESLEKYYKENFTVIQQNKPYPFKDNFFDFIFSYATFEHIPDINESLAETVRILNQKGYLFFRPAWNCRSWAAKGYQVRPYSDFNILGKLIKLSIPFRDNFFVRALYMFPLRLIFLFLFLVNKNIFRDKLFYFKLKPNYEIFWQSDSDAVNSIDPFICSLYFISNGFKILNYPNIFKSLFIKSDYLLMQKL